MEKAAEAETPADGTYTCEVTLEGGSGRATVESPAALTVADGKMTATIVWSSPNYDYMIVDGEKYLPTNTEAGYPADGDRRHHRHEHPPRDRVYADL